MKMTRKARGFGLAGLFACIFGNAICAAATLTVPAQFTDIQSAIDAAANGDTILVAAGSYQGALDFTGKTVALISQSGAAVTNLFVTNGQHMMKFQGNDRSTVVSGFTIQRTAGSTAAMLIEAPHPPSQTIGLLAVE